MSPDAATGVWAIRGTPAWNRKFYLYEVEVFAPVHRARGAKPRHRSLFPEPLDQQPAQPDRGPRGPLAPAGRVDANRQAPAGEPRGRRDLRAPRSGLQHPRRDGSRGAPRDLQGVHPRRFERDAPSPRPRAGGPQPRPPAARLRLRHGQRGQGRARRARRGRPPLAPRRLRPAGRDRLGAPREGRLQLGVRPAPLRRSRGELRDRPRRSRAHPGVSGDGAGSRGRRPAGRDGRRVQPHPRERPGSAVDPGPHRPRLLPPPRRRRQGPEQHVLSEHRDRASDDGEADARHRRDLGEGVQGRRLPLRRHGPPHGVEHDEGAGGSRRPHPVARRRGRSRDLRLRRGMGLRRGGRERARPERDAIEHGRDGDRHVQRSSPGRRARRGCLRQPAGARLRHRPRRRSGGCSRTAPGPRAS